MISCLLVAQSYFDGQRHHERGPFTIAVRDGWITEIARGDVSPAISALALRDTGRVPRVVKAPFVMPGLVEAHCHLFLDGGELDLGKRKAYLDESFEVMLATGRRSLERNLAAGVTLIRDAGDLPGVNTRLAAELVEASAHAGVRPELISAGRALRKTGRYGAFMAVEAGDADAIVRLLGELTQTADQLKILLSGIIDFEKGCMKGGVQFSFDEVRLITRSARELGRLTFAHCSGAEGLRAAVEAGIDSIEHGYFMERAVLEAMAAKGIAWVPTFAPVHFQHDRPELAGWNPATVDGLRCILDHHRKHLALAVRLGVPIVAGSDAGSYGVPHGVGLIDELVCMRQAGLTMEQVLAAATAVPRRQWSCDPADIAVGHRANFVTLARSPFDDALALREVTGVLVDAQWHEIARPAASSTRWLGTW